ncbi:MAG: macro domain-containing protein [Fibrobacteria bacterium]
MLQYTHGNLLESQVEALVNTVNEVGVMGKGIALMFKEAFPENTNEYMAACKKGDVKVGRVFVTENNAITGPKWIINFPTKKHWRNPSKIEWVNKGLDDLVRVVREKEIKSIAIPPLGCGNGGLDWKDVRPLIEKAFGKVADVEVSVYAPISHYLNSPKPSGIESLTPSRAMIVELIRRYSILGMECSLLEVQKLAWFLNRALDRLAAANPLKLHFAPLDYGPYADGLRHLLNTMDGSYLRSEKRISDAGPFDPVAFNESHREEVVEFLKDEESKSFVSALEASSRLINGFESPLGMELLATVDWLLSQQGVSPNLQDIKEALAHWPGGKSAAKRKLRLFDDRMISLALARLADPSESGVV